jgi:hypothetical protein
VRLRKTESRMFPARKADRVDTIRVRQGNLQPVSCTEERPAAQCVSYSD